ncbi:MAG: DUF3108 domain-containing protein [Saprospiraceae bacterium]|nr:DUF3108 domain-containing protein [Saprospiraceae bacterium]MCB9310350.1 DUF3108 domain-containing protein [Lewinellaceae bacterium]
MKLFKFSVAFLFLIVSYVLTTGFYVETENKNCSIENTAFSGGEHLVYKAYYNWQFIWIPAGEAVFDVKENVDTYDVTVTGTTYKSYESFFRVKDYFHTIIDKKTMYPKEFVRIVEEGNYRKFDSLVFFKETDAVLSFNGKTRSSAQKKIIHLDGCSHDLLSVLYFMRNINVNAYKVGDFIPTNLVFDEEKYPINVRYIGKERSKQIKGLGEFDTVEVMPDLVTGNVFKDGNRMHVWVTDDKNKLPLLIESPLAVGSAKAILKSYKGLRNPFTNKG